ncbi:MAG: acyltransferase [Marmoricola sp.]
MTGERTWRLGRRPALDSVRAIAVLLVVGCHGHVPGIPTAGAVGVVAFLTLSGFLITSLLVEEVERDGRVRLGRFYLHRALRLLPAMLVLVVAVQAVGHLVGPGYSATRPALATVFYGNNWLLAPGHFLHDALSHTWSLSIEEQFYVAWPLVVLALRRRPTQLLALTVVAAVASTLLCFALWDGGAGMWRVYFGTDTRASAILVGCTLALLVHRGRIVFQHCWLAPVGAAVLAASCIVPDSSAAAFLLVPVFATVGATCMIWGAASEGTVGGLETRPMQWVGKRSYGIYLWHIPVAQALYRTDAGWQVVALVTLVSGTSLAALSWRYVEEPFLRLKNRLAQPAPVAAGAPAVLA